MLLTTPDEIRTQQRKLYTKAKQESAYRFYALYDKVWQADILMFAGRLVRANQGSPGIDGMNFEDLEQKIGVDMFLLELGSRQGSDKGWLYNSVCLGVKNIGKPCALIAHARFDEGGQAKLTMAWLMRHRRTKGAETDRPSLRKAESCSLLYLLISLAMSVQGKMF